LLKGEVGRICELISRYDRAPSLQFYPVPRTETSYSRHALAHASHPYTDETGIAFRRTAICNGNSKAGNRNYAGSRDVVVYGRREQRRVGFGRRGARNHNDNKELTMSEKNRWRKVAVFSAAAIAFSGMLALSAASSFAHGGGGGGNHGHGGGGGGTHVGFGGKSASHISARGLANTNGPNASTRLFGRDRAAARRGLHSSRHNSTSLHGTPNGGQSASHISAQGLANTNGPNATTRLFGRDRARARANAHSHIPSTDTNSAPNNQ
jgi:hypothetical protein